MRIPAKLTGICIVVFLGILLSPLCSLAEEYIIGPEDLLQISFWQDPQLNQEVQVRQDGKITLSIIGEITAAGLTSRELADKIEKNVSLYNKKISQATVTVIGFNSQKVFITGQVASPGRKTFEVIPDLWTVIKEAGGANEFGDLSRVTIIRSKESGGETITINMLEAIANGRLENLPKLKTGDTIEVPRMAGGVPGRQLTADYSERKNLFYVLGQVRQPGTISYEGETDLFDALGSAGGLTEMADMSDITIISKNADGSTVMKVDLNKVKSRGQARRVLIKREDTIIIAEKKRSFLSWSLLRDFTAIAGTVISFIYLIDRR